MRSTEWFILGGLLLAVGGGILLISQILLARWLKYFRQE